jgi:thioredoxin 1
MLLTGDHMQLKKKFNMKSIILIFLFGLSLSIGNEVYGQSDKPNGEKTKVKKTNYQVTFIELGSVRCIPCKMMQPVMKSIEEKYRNTVKVEFHDVWTEKGRPFATKYGISAIPTQIFLDKDGKEYYRHEGFFPENELIKIIELKVLKRQLTN